MKVIDILLNFTKEQLHSFDLFMKSPFFEISLESLVLQEFIAPYLRKGDFSDFDRIAFYQHFVQKNGKTSKARFNKLVFLYRKTIEQFLSHYELSKSSEKQDEFILDAYAQFPNSKFYQNVSHQIMADLEATDVLDCSTTLQLYKFQKNQYYHAATPKLNPATTKLLQNVGKNLDQFYLLSRLQLVAEILTRKQIMKEELDVQGIDDLLLLAKKQTAPITTIYGNLINLLYKGHREKLYTNTLELLFQNLTLFQKQEQGIVAYLLVNYTNRLFVKNSKKYLPRLFELDQLIVNNKLNVENDGYISEASFLNTIVIACLSKAFDAAYRFLTQNKKRLLPSRKLNITYLGMAYIHFHSSEFEEAYAYLQKTNFSSTDYKLRARSLILRCVYEDFLLKKKPIDQLEYELQNFRKFIYRLGSTSDAKKTNYYNQIKVIRGLMNVGLMTKSKKDFKSKWNTFIYENPIVARKWLLEKVKQI